MTTVENKSIEGCDFAQWFADWEYLFDRYSKKILPSHWEDLKSDAVLRVFVQWKKDPVFGFDHTRGSLKSLISTVIFRSVQKSLTQFRHPCLELKVDVSDGGQKAVSTEESADLREMISTLEKTDREIVLHCLAGHRVDDFPSGSSRRTVYRRLKSAVETLSRIYGR